MILSDQEKLLRGIAKEFQEKRFIGDIVLNEAEEKALNTLMRSELARLKESPAAFKPISGEAFALGIILYGQKGIKDGAYPSFLSMSRTSMITAHLAALA